MITFKQKGDFKNTEKFLNAALKLNYVSVLEKYGREGVLALSAATPVDSSLTAHSWDYEIRNTGNTCRIIWTNSHVVDGVLIAVILQYGHGTKNGGYVQGRDYINPAIKPIFDRITEDAWKEVSKA